MKIYYFIYYVLYKTTYKTNKDIVEWTSMIFFSIMILLNVYAIMFFLFPKLFDTLTKKEYYLVVFILLIINYFVFIHKKKYKLIIDEYSKNKIANNILGKIITFVYIIISICLVIIVNN